MGFFDFMFGGKPKSPGGAESAGGRFRFTRSVEMHTELYHALKTILSEDQRKQVEAILSRYMGGGGVTRGKIDTWIVRDLRKLRDEGELSRVEYDAVMRFLRG